LGEIIMTAEAVRLGTFDHKKWSQGQKYFLEGIPHSNHLKNGFARKCIHYYAWCGDRERNLQPMPGPANIEKRHRFYMSVIDRSAKGMELPGFWRSAEEKASWAAANWTPDPKHRQQRLNRERHMESSQRIEEAYAHYWKKHNKAPSRNELSIVARCRKDAASNFLRQRGQLSSGPARKPAGEAPRQAPTSDICTSTNVSFLRTNNQKKRSNMASGPAGNEAGVMAAGGPNEKKPLPTLPPKPISAFELAVHTNGSCHLEKQCRICAKEA
jgi:hypothetical protein